MGTNYYWSEPSNECPTCGHDLSCGKIHIGKSSAGWCFSLNTHPEIGITSLGDWVKKWEFGKITDEYNSSISPLEMLNTITKRSWDKKHSLSPFQLEKNHAFYGSFGLLRHKVDGRHCIANGEGTYDLMHGEFS